MVTGVVEDEKVVSATARKDAVSANFRYTLCYCEENIYFLCKTLSAQGLAANDASDLFVVFISNDIQQVPFWKQRNSSQPDGLCVWDYHVICIQKFSNGEESQVWDLDSALPLPVPLNNYAMAALQPGAPFDRKYQRLFRVVRAPLFFRFFASDRRHMKSPEGIWLASPPAYDCIVSEDGEVHALLEYNTMTGDQVISNGETIHGRLQQEKYGVVLSEDGMLQFFGGVRAQTRTVSNHSVIA